MLKLYRREFSGPWVDEEAAITARVLQTGLPVPAVDEVVEVDGRRGIIFERIDGPSLLDDMFSRPWTLPAAARLVAELHAQMHAHTHTKPPRLKRRLEDRIGRVQGLPAPLKEDVLSMLRDLPEESAVCHGDFHPANILLSPRGPVIIDWVDAAVGNPLADVARTLVLARVGAPPGVLRQLLLNAVRSTFRRIYLRRYAELRPLDREQLGAWIRAVAASRLTEGIPGERDRLLAMLTSR